jgi:hypothetical protein
LIEEGRDKVTQLNRCEQCPENAVASGAEAFKTHFMQASRFDEIIFSTVALPEMTSNGVNRQGTKQFR